jgi:hypothetical protein
MQLAPKSKIEQIFEIDSKFIRQAAMPMAIKAPSSVCSKAEQD